MKLFLFSSRIFHSRWYSNLPKYLDAAIDWNYLCNPKNFHLIAENIIQRKVHCNMIQILEQLNELHTQRHNTELYATIKKNLTPQVIWLPNSTHPKVLMNKSEEPVLIKKVGKKSAFSYFPASFDSLTKRLNVLRTKFLGHVCGNKSYFLKSDLASLEQALIRFTLAKLIKKGYKMISVPDIITKENFEQCGMQTEGKHSQVYFIDRNWGKDLCLSGTSEMALASYVSERTWEKDDLPLKLCAYSRCYRAEANRHQKEKGIFRVHQFTKVEMFGVTANEVGNESEDLLDEFVHIQEEIFSEIGLHFKIMEMPPCDLGLPAYHKVDMETWIPTQKIYGEISSASNCTDYQSRRLNIKYFSPVTKKDEFCHTVNGTASAIPRLLIAIVENFQNLDGSISVPKPLQDCLQKETISEKLDEALLCKKPVG